MASSGQAWDVVIVGGGPAGLSTALSLSRHPVTILVLEQQPYPVSKPCGEGIMPTGLAHLKTLGVLPFLQARPHRPFSGITYHSAGSHQASANFQEGPGWGMERTVLSEGLREAVQSQTNITLHQAQVHVEVQGESVRVRVGSESLTPKLVIGADGLNSRIRKAAGLSGTKSRLQRWGVRQHFQVAPWTDQVEVYWAWGAEAYVTPVGPDRVGVAILWDRHRKPPEQAGKLLFLDRLALFPKLQERLQSATPTDVPRAVGPLHRRTSGVIRPGLALIGDASGYLDAITGEGLSLAFEQAVVLGEIVGPALRKDAPERFWALQRYASSHAAITRPYHQVTHLALMLRNFPALTDRIVRMFSQNPQHFQHFLSANMGLVPSWRLPPRAWAEMLAGLFKNPPLNALEATRKQPELS